MTDTPEQAGFTLASSSGEAPESPTDRIAAEVREQKKKLSIEAIRALLLLGTLSHVYQVRDIDPELRIGLFRFCNVPLIESANDYHTYQAIEADAQDGEITIRNINSKKKYTVSATALYTAPEIDFETAYDLVLLAMANPAMRENGVRLTGGTQDRALLYFAAKKEGLKVENTPDSDILEQYAQLGTQWAAFAEQYDPAISSDLLSEIIDTEERQEPSAKSAPGAPTPAPRPA